MTPEGGKDIGFNRGGLSLSGFINADSRSSYVFGIEKGCVVKEVTEGEGGNEEGVGRILRGASLNGSTDFR